MDKMIKIKDADALESVIYDALSEEDYVTVVAKSDIILDLLKRCLQNEHFLLESASILSGTDEDYYFEIWDDFEENHNVYLGFIYPAVDEKTGVYNRIYGTCFVHSFTDDRFFEDLDDDIETHDLTAVRFYMDDEDCGNCITRYTDGVLVYYCVPLCAKKYIEAFDELYSETIG